jgi:hypothetical protein
LTRTIDAALVTASQSDTVVPIFLLQLAYDSGTVRFHTGLGDISFNGNTYTGVGDFGSFSAIEEPSGIEETAIDLILSGVDASLVSLSFNEFYQGRTATIWLGFKNVTTGALIAPTIVFLGVIDNTKINLGKTATIILRVTNNSAFWSRINDKRYTDEDQQATYPGDTAFKYIAQIQEKRNVWGAAAIAEYVNKSKNR